MNRFLSSLVTTTEVLARLFGRDLFIELAPPPLGGSLRSAGKMTGAVSVSTGAWACMWCLPHARSCASQWLLPIERVTGRTKPAYRSH